LNEKFAGVMTANHPESLALIRPFLIDFGCSRGFRAAICAKFFKHAYLRVANGVDTKCNARHAKTFRSKHAQCVPMALQKPLFHRVFLIFSRACTI